MVPLAENQALGIAIMSYNGQLNFGLNADYDAVADLEALADELRASIEELVAAAKIADADMPSRREARARRGLSRDRDVRWATIADEAARAPRDRAALGRDRRRRDRAALGRPVGRTRQPRTVRAQRPDRSRSTAISVTLTSSPAPSRPATTQIPRPAVPTSRSRSDTTSGRSRDNQLLQALELGDVVVDVRKRRPAAAICAGWRRRWPLRSHPRWPRPGRP